MTFFFFGILVCQLDTLKTEEPIKRLIHTYTHVVMECLKVKEGQGGRARTQPVRA